MYISLQRSCRLDTNRPLIVVKCRQLVEPFGEVAVRQDVIHRGGRLEQLDLRQHLELTPPFVKVDESAVGRVAERRVDHHQVRQERTQVRHRTLNYRHARLYTANIPQHSIHVRLRGDMYASL